MDHPLERPLQIFQKIAHRRKPENVNETQKENLSLQDKLALAITGALGTMWAVYFFAIFMGLWMAYQATLSRNAFDPYPYAFLLFLGNIVQLLLMPLIMVGQNIQGRHAELRAEEQFKTTLASFQDSEHIMEHLNALDAELLRHRQMLEKIGQQLEGTTGGGTGGIA